MAYQRRYRRYRNPVSGRRGRVVRKRRVAMATGSRSFKKRIRNIVGVEKKHIETLIDSQAVSYNGFLDNLSEVAQGDNQNQRDGIKINPVGLTMRYLVRGFGGSTGTVDELVRVIIFRGKRENSNTPVVGDINASLGSPTSIYRGKNWDKRFNTKILYDKTHKVSPPPDDVGLAHDRNGVYVNHHIKLDKWINYDRSDTSGATIENGGIYIMLLGQTNNGGAGSGGVGSSFTGVFRLTFNDA